MSPYDGVVRSLEAPSVPMPDLKSVICRGHLACSPQ